MSKQCVGLHHDRVVFSALAVASPTVLLAMKAQALFAKDHSSALHIVLFFLSSVLLLDKGLHI